MFYAFKYYHEVFQQSLPVLPFHELAQGLQGQSFLGNFLAQQGNLFSAQEIYPLMNELYEIRKYADPRLHQFIAACEAVEEYLTFHLEFLNMQKNQDLLVFTFTHDKNHPVLKVYELFQIAPILFQEEDFQIMMRELSQFGYEAITEYFLLHGQFLTLPLPKAVQKEMQTVLFQQMVSKKTRQALQFLLKRGKKEIKKEQFVLVEKYLSVYH